MMQATLRDRLRFEGVGLHTGARTRVDVEPANEDEGLNFVSGTTRIPATAEFVVDTSRATVLGRDGVTISTTEHLLSALFALGVSNAEIVVDGPEIPICDGSASEFSRAIESCGIQRQPGARKTLDLDEPVVLRDDDKLIAAFPAPAFRARFLADFPAPVGTQYVDTAVEPEAYRSEIAAARTFGFLHEVEALRARGLALGGTLENALVFGPDGPLQPLRWPNEAVRHKTLDLIGDLALIGAWPRAEIVAIKCGHGMHTAMAMALRERLRVLRA